MLLSFVYLTTLLFFLSKSVSNPCLSLSFFSLVSLVWILPPLFFFIFFKFLVFVSISMTAAAGTFLAKFSSILDTFTKIWGILLFLLISLPFTWIM